MQSRTIGLGLLDELSNSAERSSRRRQHFNLHRSFEDPCQRLLNAISRNSYIPPHRHAMDGKTETLIALRGAFALITFTDGGEVQNIERFASEAFSDHNGVDLLGVEVFPETWHTVIALSDNSVLLELKPGPFNPEAAKELAHWAPGEQDEGAGDYFCYLRSLVYQ